MSGAAIPAAVPAAARLVGRRLLAAVPVLAAVTFGVFALAAASPFDPVQQYAGAAGLSASQETLDQLRANLALDGPFPQRRWEWLTSAVQGDLGDSTSLRQPVAQAIGERLGWSVLLCAAGFCFAVTAGTALGVAAARRRGGLLDRIVTPLAYTPEAAPPFWIGLLGIWLFAIRLDVLPAGGLTDSGSDVVTAGRCCGTSRCPSAAGALVRPHRRAGRGLRSPGERGGQIRTPRPRRYASGLMSLP
ncbi:peptide/nickel transport system permease protein [Streptomyces qinglanensis]|uniref:Peptide/nickel transport system permease protein n=1 Tax=Streptomyces qinglanensis TaxID=943816 RepID=A0A1H9TL43_9ACTN|nr:peptide/nickel transport system permease protein [Streptomyces qinglanensis]